MKYFGVELIRQKFTDLSTTKKPCSDWEGLRDGPGLSELKTGNGNSRVAKSVEQCYWDHFHTNLNCRLPWSEFFAFIINNYQILRIKAVKCFQKYFNL